jgi:hypothetical protein
MKPDGSDVANITVSAANDQYGAISPDAMSFAYATDAALRRGGIKPPDGMHWKCYRAAEELIDEELAFVLASGEPYLVTRNMLTERLIWKKVPNSSRALGGATGTSYGSVWQPIRAGEGALGPWRTREIALKLRVNAPKRITLSATVSGSLPELDPSTNTATKTTNVR